MLRAFAIVLGLSSLAFTTVSANDENTDVASSTAIKAWVEGTNTESGKLVQIFFRNESDSEIVLRELKDVSVHCEAEYPVQLDFKSHGGFKLLATGSGSTSKTYSNGTHQSTVQKHTTYAHLVSLKESYTGVYTCQGRSSQTKHETISTFIYVPTEKLFVSRKTATVSSLGLTPVLIPCPVSDPNATVTLVKVHGKDIVKPVLGATYNPRVGFKFGSPEGSNVTDSGIEGTYYCIAKTSKVHRALEFTVVDGPVTCSARCDENSKCEIVNEIQVCECKPTYTETLVSGKCLMECSTDKDCPSFMACMPQESGSFLIDILSSVEGRAAEDKDQEEEHVIVKRGECKNPCIYRTTTCSLSSATTNLFEECQVLNHKAICVSSEQKSV